MKFILYDQIFLEKNVFPTLNFSRFVLFLTSGCHFCPLEFANLENKRYLCGHNIYRNKY